VTICKFHYKVSNDRQCNISSYYEEKLMIFMKILSKEVFRSWILGKTPEQIWAHCETWVPFFNDFQNLYEGSNTIKKLEKLLIFKNNLNFHEKMGVLCLPLPSPNFFFQILYILSDFDELLYEKYLFECCLKIKTK